MSTPSISTSLITPSRSGAQGFRSRMLWETVKFNFALVGLGLGSESVAKLFRDDSPILTIVEPPPAASVDQPIFDEGLLEEGLIESPIAGGDKLQELRNALAGNLSEPPLISTNTETSPPAFFDKPTNEEPAEQTPVDAPADAGNLAIRTERAKSVLDGLNLDTAIRLRWVLRDIRAKRTNLSPISQNDLMALTELGLIEMQNDEPALTNEGMRAIAHSTGPTGPNEGERGE
ncbi:MAG TPA: hypothetical protein VNY32_10940 [Candidatus Acidoferrales bacterium]|nr:hypothetical protein [Candidatus Acidoferrales bacterium]